MFNVSGSEIIVILLLALVVLGPEKLPDAMRKAGRTYAELKRMSNSFQEEFRNAVDEPLNEVRQTAEMIRKTASFDVVPDDKLKPKSLDPVAANAAAITKRNAARAAAKQASDSNEEPAAFPADPQDPQEREQSDEQDGQGGPGEPTGSGGPDAADAVFPPDPADTPDVASPPDPAGTLPAADPAGTLPAGDPAGTSTVDPPTDR